MVECDTSKKCEYVKVKAIELALLEFIKDKKLVTEDEYVKIKLKIEQEYIKHDRLNNFEKYTYAGQGN